ncbi:ferric reductase-like transmembrane domain-containing protein [Peptostreptococcus equinus]|uniref:Ferric reductase-like transmembrane domain-containing protein n=1 Tax=Peptostreptococcus equinus TaxID=3003601 RepID=A0ABY7JN28_9FIRM|nr:ferric reductase-like transmembrane domain-containing protein [Peptostreptococcus sp. CBA3647]WAW14569.1 ferric reductase-like transmembrane domain-containing protein [Peptostreptococcus sp. CBA3647]
MVLIIGMIFTLALIWFSKDLIKKYPKTSYLISFIVALAVVYIYYTGMNKTLPKEFVKYFLNIFKRGIFATTIFIVVMYLGCFTKHNYVSKKLMVIRGEISIIACIFALTHNIIYGKKYFVWLLFDRSKLNTNQFIAVIISLIMIALMIILMVTSFKCVRKKMSGLTWKRVQRLAYPFFLLIYVHVMALYVAKYNKKVLDMIIYTLIFGLYVFFRLRKQSLKKRQRLAINK